MIHIIVNAFKSVNDNVYHDKLTIDNLKYARSFLLTLAEFDHILNQLCYSVMILEYDVYTIYKYINTLSN